MIKILFIFGIFRSKTAGSSSSDDDKCDSYSKKLDQQSSFCSNNGSLNQENKKNWALIPYSQFENSNTDILPLFSVKQRRVKIGNLEFNFDQDWRGSGVAGVVWDASLSLAEYLLNDRSLEGKFILELGSGASAIPSLVCASQALKKLMDFFSLLVDLSRLQIVWLFLTFAVLLPASLTLKVPNFLPFLNDLVKYGKVRSIRMENYNNYNNTLIRYIEVPKKWFSHFYIFASIWAFFCWEQLIFYYYFDIKPWPILTFIVDQMAKPGIGKRTVDEFGSLLTLSLFFLHTVRRLSESVFVSVYSDTKMNLIHYIFGYAHYFFVPVTILASAPGFCGFGKFAFNFNALTFCQIVGICIFFYASYAQDRCFWILSQMRKNQDGNITNYAHGIPITYYFDYVSCPHFLFEILIYFSLILTSNLRNLPFFGGVFLFVSTNQIAAALITHRWYKEKYKKMYPENRKALLPYLF